MQKRLDKVQARSEERADVVAWLRSEKFKEEYYEGGISGVIECIQKGWHEGAAGTTYTSATTGRKVVRK